MQLLRLERRSTVWEMASAVKISAPYKVINVAYKWRIWRVCKPALEETYDEHGIAVLIISSLQ